MWIFIVSNRKRNIFLENPIWEQIWIRLWGHLGTDVREVQPNNHKKLKTSSKPLKISLKMTINGPEPVNARVIAAEKFSGQSKQRTPNRSFWANSSDNSNRGNSTDSSDSTEHLSGESCLLLTAKLYNLYCRLYITS